MRKAKRNAIKLESTIQRLTVLKVSGSVDERKAAKRKLADGLNARVANKQRIKHDGCTEILGGTKRL